MKNLLLILFLIALQASAQTSFPLYVPTNPDSIKTVVNVNGAPRVVYNIDLVKYRAALIARDTAAALRLLIAGNTSAIATNTSNISANTTALAGAYKTVTTLPDSTGFTINRPDGTKDTIQIAIPATVDTTNKWVNSIYKLPGKDSIYFRIGATTYAVKDSTSAAGGGDATALHLTGNETVTSGTKTLASPFSVTGGGAVVWSPLKITSAFSSGVTSDTLAPIYINTSFTGGTSLNKWGIYSNRDFNVNGVRIGNGNSTDATNVVMGKLALDLVTTGSTNGHTAIGWSSFKNASNASFGNTGVGYSTGINVTGGTRNTALGFNSMYSTSTGVGSNTALGYQTLGATTGSNNTAVGAFANSAGASGSGNVFIGYQSGQNETGSNKFYLNNTNVGGLIVGDFSTGQVQINAEPRNSTPASSLTSAATFEVNNNPSIANRGAISAPRMVQAQRDAITLQTGVVTKIYVTAQGAPTSAPTVSISGSGTGATATATFVSGAYYITVTNGGTGYTPGSTTVTITGGGTTGATGYAVVGNGGLSVYCLDCTATDSSIGVLQYWNGSAWKNAW